MSTAMTPEEQLRAMAADASRWELAPWTPTQRPSTAAVRPERVSRGRWWAIGFSTVAVVVVAAIVLLVAVNFRGTTPAPPITTNTPSPSSTPIPSSTPTPTRTEEAPSARADEEAPAQLFGGSCDAFLDAQDLDGIVGAPMTLVDAPIPDRGQRERDIVAAVHGGLECQWRSASAQIGLELVALPIDQIDPLVDSTCATGYSEEFGGGGCTVAVRSDTIQVSGGLSFSSTAQGMDAHADEARDMAQRLVPAIRASLATAPVFHPSLDPVGMWDLSGSYCKAVDASIDASDLMGKAFALSDGGGTDSIPPPALMQLMPSGSVFTTCLWSGSSDFVSTQSFAGAAWLEPEVAAQPGAAPVTVEGFDHAYLVDGSNGGNYRRLELFRGANWLSVYLDGDRRASDYTDLALGIEAALDARSGSAEAVVGVTAVLMDSAALQLITGSHSSSELSYFVPPVTAISTLRAVFGADPRIALRKDSDHGDELTYSWDGFELSALASTATDSFRVHSSSATAGGLPIQADGGVAVGDTVKSATAAYGPSTDGGGRAIGATSNDEWRVDVTGVQASEWGGTVTPGQDLGKKYVLVYNDRSGPTVTGIQAPILEYSH